MEKKVIKKETLDNLFLNLLAFADLDKIARCVNVFMYESYTEDEVLEHIKECYNNLCQDIADKEIDDSSLPIGYGWGYLMLEYTDRAIVLADGKLLADSSPATADMLVFGTLISLPSVMPNVIGIYGQNNSNIDLLRNIYPKIKI